MEPVESFDFDAKFLKQHNISNFSTFEELHKSNCRDIPDKCGVYIVFCPLSFKVQFKASTDGLEQYNSRELTVSIQALQDKWVPQTHILYIGKAGGTSNTLLKRVRQYVRYGYREVQNHRGGRYIWQLEGDKNLLIGYKVLINEDAKMYEENMLTQFEEHFHKLPFANLKH